MPEKQNTERLIKPKSKPKSEKVNLNKMCYSEFIAYLESKSIKRMEETDVDIDFWMTEYITVTPIESKLKERYFSTDGGYQLH